LCQSDRAFPNRGGRRACGAWIGVPRNNDSAASAASAIVGRFGYAESRNGNRRLRCCYRFKNDRFFRGSSRASGQADGAKTAFGDRRPNWATCPPNIGADARAQKIIVDGTVYTTILDPIDEEKNWHDMVTAFCWAFRDDAGATLILKNIPGDFGDFPHRLMRVLSQLAPFRCRVISVEAEFDGAACAQLVNATRYYVNTSECEGICLPVMEFMAQGKPVIAPCHTALEDCIDADSAFVVACSRQAAAFPYHKDERICTDSYRLNWESLRAAFQESHRTFSSQPDRYAAMAQAARSRIQAIASSDTVEDHLKRFFADGPDKLNAEPKRVRTSR
jgi:glycosyltransferase involved in cell wall biosynthesis